MSSIFDEIYNIILNGVFGGDISSHIYADFFCEAGSFIFCAFLVALPLLVVWRVIKLFLN